MRKLALCTLLLLQAFFTFAQTETGVSGTVIDSKTQKPIENAVVTVLNTINTQLTDAEGKFKLTSVAVGSQMIVVKTQGFKEVMLPVEITSGKISNLDLIPLEIDESAEQQLSLVTITESDLGDDNSGSESTSGLLQASRDAYQQAAAFNWGQSRFRIRGLDNEYGNTLINGISMNKIYDGRPQYGNWGGLNDATRNQEFTMGSAPSDYIFGGILGTQEINTRASIYRPGSRISFSGSNTNYNARIMGTHASGMDKNGWAYVVSAGRRWAQEAYFEGTDYQANSVFASIEKRISDNHSLNITAIYAQNERGKNSPNTTEVNDLMGVKYNSYWGWQDGKKRNSRDKDLEEPIFILSHYWKINPKTRLNTNVSYQFGKIGNSRLDYQSANSPDPTYYRNLPSYYLNYHAEVNNQIVWLPNYTQADIAKQYFLNNSQINWNAMYLANQNTANGNSAYVLYEDRTDDKQISANAILASDLADNISLNAGATFKQLESHNFQNLLDLLGGKYLLDVDPFYQGDATQTNLLEPNRQVMEGDKYGYNYKLFATVADAFTQFKFTYKKADFYLGQTYSRSEFQREGVYKNGIYANNSFGKSDKVLFENFGFKSGVTFKITGKNLLNFNGVHMTKAPTIRNTFANARLNNNITPDLTSETISSVDASYIYRSPKFKARITGFMSKIQNVTELSFFYAENISDAEGDEDAFVSEIVTGINKRNIGAEIGMEYQVTSTVKVTGAASYGQYTYDNNPNLRVNDDAQATATNTFPLVDFGKTYLKGYRQPGMPQQAYSLGIEYRDPHFWWIGFNGNYLADSYLDVSNILRTNNFSIDNTTGVSYPGANETTVRAALKQEKFDPFMLFNLTGGKSWMISKKNRNTVGFFATVNNVFDVVYKTGGFEQSRKATFPDMQQDLASGTRAFGSKYFYGYGRTFFINLYINF